MPFWLKAMPILIPTPGTEKTQYALALQWTWHFNVVLGKYLIRQILIFFSLLYRIRFRKHLIFYIHLYEIIILSLFMK